MHTYRYELFPLDLARDFDRDAPCRLRLYHGFPVHRDDALQQTTNAEESLTLLVFINKKIISHYLTIRTFTLRYFSEFLKMINLNLISATLSLYKFLSYQILFVL